MKSLQQLMTEQPHVSAEFRSAFAEANEKAAGDLEAISAVAKRHREGNRAAETALQAAIRNAGLDMAALPKSKQEQILKAMRGLYWSAISEGMSVRAEIDNG